MLNIPKLEVGCAYDTRRREPFTGAALGSALSTAGATVGSGILNLIGLNKTNKNNLKMQREQNQFNLEQWQREAAFTREMWNAENEYNDPSRQMARLTDAGLSPWAAASVIGAGDAQSVATPSSAPAASAHIQSPNFDFIGNAVDKVFGHYQAWRLKEAEIKNKETENSIAQEVLLQNKIKTSVDQQFGIAMAQSALDNSLYDQHNKKYDAALKLQQIDQNAAMFQLEQNYHRQQNTLLARSIEYQEIQNGTAKIAQKMDELRLGNLPKELAADLALRFAEIDNRRAAAGLSRAAAETQKAQAAKEWLSAYGVKLDNDVAEKLSEIRVGTAAMQFLAPYEDYYGTNRHYNRAGKVLSPIVGMLGLGLGFYAGRGRSAMKGVKSFGRVGNGAFTQFE